MSTNVDETIIQNETKEEVLGDATQNIEPLVDFSEDHVSEEEYQRKCSLVKQYCNEKLQKYLGHIVIGIIFIIAVPKSGVFGLILFIASIFYLLPMGIIKSISWIYKRFHFEDYVEYKYDSNEIDFYSFMRKNLKKK